MLNAISFDNDENVQVSQEAIGFSCEFRNLFVLDDSHTPSIIVGDIGKLDFNCMKKLFVKKEELNCNGKL